MKIRLRKLGFISFMMLLALYLAACNASTNNGTAQPVSTETAVNSEKEPVTLRIAFFGNQVRTAATLEALKAYTAKNPHVTFSPEYVGQNAQYIDKLSTQAAGRNTADIFTMEPQWFEGFASRGQLADLGDSINIADIDPVLIEKGKHGGKLYAIPIATNALGMVYNKAMLDELGIPEPAVNWTWDDYFQFGYDVKAKLPEGKYALLDGSYEMLTFTAYQHGKGKGTTLEKDGTFNFDRDTFLELMYKYKELREAGVVPPAEITATVKDVDVAMDPLLNGSVLLRRGFTSTLGGYNAVHPNSYAMVPFPRDVKGSSYLRLSSMWSVSPNSKHIDEAKKFIDWFVNDEEANSILKTVRGFPTSSKILKFLAPTMNEIDKAGLELIETIKAAGDVAPDVPTPDGWSPFVSKDYVKVAQEIMFGQKTPEEGYDEIVKLAQTYVK